MANPRISANAYSPSTGFRTDSPQHNDRQKRIPHNATRSTPAQQADGTQPRINAQTTQVAAKPPGHRTCSKWWILAGPVGLIVWVCTAHKNHKLEKKQAEKERSSFINKAQAKIAKLENQITSLKNTAATDQQNANATIQELQKQLDSQRNRIISDQEVNKQTMDKLQEQVEQARNDAQKNIQKVQQHTPQLVEQSGEIQQKILPELKDLNEYIDKYVKSTETQTQLKSNLRLDSATEFLKPFITTKILNEQSVYNIKNAAERLKFIKAQLPKLCEIANRIDDCHAEIQDAQAKLSLKHPKYQRKYYKLYSSNKENPEPPAQLIKESLRLLQKEVNNIPFRSFSNLNNEQDWKKHVQTANTYLGNIEKNIQLMDNYLEDKNNRITHPFKARSSDYSGPFKTMLNNLAQEEKREQEQARASIREKQPNETDYDTIN